MGFIGMLGGLALGMPRSLALFFQWRFSVPRDPALVLFECQWVWQRNCHESTIGFISMSEALALISFLIYLITRLRAIVQLDGRVACHHVMGRY